VKVDVLNSCIAKDPLDRRSDALTCAYIGVDDHVSRIVRPKRHETKTDVLRHLVDGQKALLRALSHKYGTRGPVRRGCRLVRIRQQEQVLPDFRIDETHSNSFTAWKKMGSPAKPTEEQMAALEKAGKLEMLEPAQVASYQEAKKLAAAK